MDGLRVGDRSADFSTSTGRVIYARPDTAEVTVVK